MSTGFADRILPLDLVVARRVASLHVPHHAPQHDALIVGTALARGLTVLTRATRDSNAPAFRTSTPGQTPDLR